MPEFNPTEVAKELLAIVCNLTPDRAHEELVDCFNQLKDIARLRKNQPWGFMAGRLLSWNVDPGDDFETKVNEVINQLTPVMSDDVDFELALLGARKRKHEGHA